MVCVFCGSPTEVKNSRLQKRSNYIWRRRKCRTCGGIFTTNEMPDLGGSIRVMGPKGKLSPFNKERLFIAVYESCKHRPSAVDDSKYLTEAIIGELLRNGSEGLVRRNDIVNAASKVLKRFDKIAATVYQAYHRVSED